MGGIDGPEGRVRLRGESSGKRGLRTSRRSIQQNASRRSEVELCKLLFVYDRPFYKLGVIMHSFIRLLGAIDT